jgi:hypothetical protein
MNQELIQYQSERIAALINELKIQEARYNSLAEVGMAVIQSLKEENKELKQQLENLKK